MKAGPRAAAPSPRASPEQRLIEAARRAAPHITGTSLLALVAIGVLWGLNWPAVKFMLTGMPPLTIRAVSFPLAALLLAMVARLAGHSLRPASRDWIPIAVTGLLVVFGFNALTVFGQMLTQTSKAAIIAYTMPAWTALFAAVFLGERLGARSALALALGMAGLAVLAAENLAALAADARGPLLMLGAAMSWALGNVALKSRTWSLSPLALTVWFFVVSSALCTPLVLAFEPPWEQAWPRAAVLWTLAYHVLGPMVVCYTLWTVLLGRLPATVAAIAVLLAPIVGVASAAALLGDPLTWHKVVALAMVLGSVVLTLRPRARAGAKRAP